MAGDRSQKPKRPVSTVYAARLSGAYRILALDPPAPRPAWVEAQQRVLWDLVNVARGGDDVAPT